MFGERVRLNGLARTPLPPFPAPASLEHGGELSDRATPRKRPGGTRAANGMEVPLSLRTMRTWELEPGWVQGSI